MSKISKKIIISLSILVITISIAGFLMVVADHANAQADNMLWGGQQGNVQSGTGLGNTDPRILIANIIRVVLGFLGIIAIILILYAGYLWMTSAGDPQKIDKAKKILISAAIGLIIILLSFAIATFILNKLYDATGATGGGPGSCTSANVGTCSGCSRCSFIAGSYQWQLDNLCPGCGGSGPGTVSCESMGVCDQTICDTMYGAGNYDCNGSCICIPLGNIGDPCDSDTGTPACDFDDSMCMSELHCDPDSCTCQGAPVIDWVSPMDALNNPNGAPGNFVTVGGRFFGTAVGKVYFTGASGEVEAKFPNTVNPNCTDFWTDQQVIVIVPDDAINGKIRIWRPDGLEDSTNDTRGPMVNDFQINAIERPGLCKIDINSGAPGETRVYQGINLVGSNINFGSYSSFVPSPSSAFTNPLTGSADVPLADQGLTTTYASTTSAYGNFLRFTITSGAGNSPYINSFEPTSGPKGTYVTIYGGGFGNSRGTNHVYFNNGSDVEANYDFPDVCSDSYWGNNQIVVKAPDAAEGNYLIRIDLGTITIDTSALSPSRFNLDNDLPLQPGLCKIQPIMGPNNSKVSVWGEYFDVHNNLLSKMRFHLNHDQQGVLSPSGPLISWGPDGDADKALAIVHNEAVSGPVRIIKSSPAMTSNGMNFRVGKCTRNDDCGTGNFCCAAGTFAAGQCVVDEEDCYADISSSVFEWQFNTGYSSGVIGDPCDKDPSTATCDPDNSMCTVGTCNPSTCICEPSSFSSCVGYGPGSCLDSIFCPNSPGQCSQYAGGAAKEVGTCDYTCNSVPGCAGGICTYNNSLDKCVKTGATCDTTKTYQDINGKDVTATCKTYNSNNYWHFSTTQSCPTGWQRIPGNQCAYISGPTCSLCSSGFTCSSGLCSVSKDMCPEGATCNSSGKCVKTDSAECECCCEIGMDARDCCAPLKCEGTCGTDTTNDGSGFGHCTGCADAGSTQADHDAACNCDGHSGKYCDMSEPGGVCRDCGQLANTTECNAHVTTCCVDEKNANACRGGDGTLMPLNYGSCAYYDCLAPLYNTCDTGNPTPTSDYADIPTCTEKCASNTGSGLGLSCASVSTSSIPSTACNFSICASPFNCLDPFGAIGTPGNCGFCCCDPDPGADQCYMLNPSLKCQADKSPCSGAGRGLCCGCSEDVDCGNTTIIGCGDDSCCRARPAVVAGSERPLDDSEKICRNSLVYAEFDTLMDPASFTSNMIVAADYLGTPCPAGTTYLALDKSTQNKNIFRRLAISIKDKFIRIFEKILPAKFVVAYSAPVASHNYCAISGQVTNYQNSSGNTVIQFKPNNLLDGDRLYYAIILGDKDLDSSKGVLSYWGIGMNGPADVDNAFNGITYGNSYIWSFRTLSLQSSNNGVCKLDHISVDPYSYLFNTNKNDTNEIDANPTDISFDTVYDSDKVFISYPKSIDGQVLAPMPDYNWTWNWVSSVPSIADAVAGIPLSDDRKLIRASETVTEGKTIETVKATIATDNIFTPSTSGQYKSGFANIYLFVCENPWPPIKAGIWKPWVDNDSNCTVSTWSSSNPSADCLNTNYEFYFCRDAGGPGTFDDLPAILDDAVIRESVSGATTTLLKEAFYMREKSTSATTTLILTPDPLGGIIKAEWSQLHLIDPLIKGYKLYWGTASGNYTNNKDITDITSLPNVEVDTSDLTNGTKYYFNFSSYYATGAESKLYGEKSAIPADITPPSAPTGFTVATTTDDKIKLSWIPAAEAASYEVLYGTTFGVFGYKDNVGLDTEVKIDGLTKGQTYYFGVVSLDASKNRSATTTKSFLYN